MIALLPEGFAIPRPDYVKLVKVISSQAQGAKTYVVAIRLDDGTELMVKTFTGLGPALALSRRCTEIINAAVHGEVLPAGLLSEELEPSELLEFTAKTKMDTAVQEAGQRASSPAASADWVRDDGSDDWE